MEKFERFRKEAPLFIYKSCTVTETADTVEIDYVFDIPGLAQFTPGWSFPKPAGFTAEGDLAFERLAFSLGMAEAVSYWKAVCSPVMRVECGSLTEAEIGWWKKLYYMGLGEFFYVNGITTDMDSFVEIQSVGSFKNTEKLSRPDLEGCLVPIGGGKDSALTLETLTSAGMKCRCYSINKRNSITGTVAAAGLTEDALITVKRRFDRSLIELNNKGYLNGHTPFSSIVAFSAEVTAFLNRLKYIVLSNEDSANESTVAGQDVNHQYSKSFEFERDFHDYERDSLKTGIYYFSFLRPLSEFQIAKMFVQHRKYLPVFRSCNLGSKVSPDIWCGECPKCLFICVVLSPFLTSAELVDIFGKDMLNDPAMSEYYRELLGMGEHKPFECVGSIDEVRLASTLTVRRMMNEGEELPLLFREFAESGLYAPENVDEIYEKCCKSYSSNNLLPNEFEEILRKEMEHLL